MQGTPIIPAGPIVRITSPTAVAAVVSSSVAVVVVSAGAVTTMTVFGASVVVVVDTVDLDVLFESEGVVAVVLSSLFVVPAVSPAPAS